MKINTLKFSLLVLGMLSISSFGQKVKKTTSFEDRVKATNTHTPDGHIRCASTEYEETLREKNKNRATTEEFESWLSEKITEARVKNKNARNATATVITIPVVVHVIHNGDAIGTDENIADAQVISQITVLNQDYRRLLGSPGYNSNAVGADIEVQFCLAQRNPNGQPTTGIDRVNLGQASWTESSAESTLKPQTVWDSSQYLNLWVCKFSGSLLGYAQFPNNSDLGGLDDFDGNANTDGVVINYDCFGSIAIYPGGTYDPTYNRGRTATHEIGHFLGLRHIWGDNDSCSTDSTDSFKDYCPDTPAAKYEHYGCPTNNNSCSASPGNDMIENYMDYTDDTCMNTFTLNQKERIRAVLQNATRRASLAGSSVCNPEAFGLDIDLDIIDLAAACNTNFIPTIKITNRGTTTITSAVISYGINITNTQTYNWSGSLPGGSSVEVVLNSIFGIAGTQPFNVSLVTLNGSADENPLNDSKTRNVTLYSAMNYDITQAILTLQRDKYASETTWSLKDSSGTVVYSSPSYNDSQSNTVLPTLLTIPFTLSANQCYTFTINDAEGDGICCTYGSGYFNLKTNAGTEIASGSNFGSSFTAKFSTESLSTNSEDYLNGITLYPNPAKNVLNISIQGDTTLPDTFIIYNSLGQIVQSTKVNSVSNLTVNTSELSTGVYFVKINKDSESKTLRFIKN